MRDLYSFQKLHYEAALREVDLEDEIARWGTGRGGLG